MRPCVLMGSDECGIAVRACRRCVSQPQHGQKKYARVQFRRTLPTKGRVGGWPGQLTEPVPEAIRRGESGVPQEQDETNKTKGTPKSEGGCAPATTRRGPRQLVISAPRHAQCRGTAVHRPQEHRLPRILAVGMRGCQHQGSGASLLVLKGLRNLGHLPALWPVAPN